MSYSLAITQAISIVLYISVKMEEGHYEYLSTKYISEKLGIPSPSVTKLLKYLLAAGIVETKEGAGGGILLKKSPKDITLLDIFLSIENQKPLFKEATINVANEKAEAIVSSMTTALNQVEDTMKASLKSTTIDDLIKDSINK